MADLQNEDPVLRESTRLISAGAFATQSTYDIFQWEKIMGVPMSDTPEQLQAIATAFGIKNLNRINLFDSRKSGRNWIF
jgi:hypothetical protein